MSEGAGTSEDSQARKDCSVAQGRFRWEWREKCGFGEILPSVPGGPLLRPWCSGLAHLDAGGVTLASHFRRGWQSGLCETSSKIPRVAWLLAHVPSCSELLRTCPARQVWRAGGQAGSRTPRATERRGAFGPVLLSLGATQGYLTLMKRLERVARGL